MKVIELRIHYYLKKSAIRNEIRFKPETQSLAGMKMEIAKRIIPLIGKLESYYSVAVVWRSDRKQAYRTIVPKTVVA